MKVEVKEAVKTGDDGFAALWKSDCGTIIMAEKKGVFLEGTVVSTPAGPSGIGVFLKKWESSKFYRLPAGSIVTLTQE